MIPKMIHQIWIGNFKIPTREQSLINNIKELHNDYTYIFWTDNNLPDLPKNVKTIYDKFYKNKNFVFCADLLRLYVAYKYGGFYFDVDWNIKRKLDDFLNFEHVFFYHNQSDLTIPNNIFAAKKESEILKYCIEQIDPNYSWYGPSWFGTTIKKYFNLPYETDQNVLKDLFNKLNSEYYVYRHFENKYGKHLSLYSWEPSKWEKLKNNEQL